MKMYHCLVWVSVFWGFLFVFWRRQIRPFSFNFRVFSLLWPKGLSPSFLLVCLILFSSVFPLKISVFILAYILVFINPFEKTFFSFLFAVIFLFCFPFPFSNVASYLETNFHEIFLKLMLLSVLVVLFFCCSCFFCVYVICLFFCCFGCVCVVYLLDYETALFPCN